MSTDQEDRHRIELSTKPTPEVLEKNEKLCRQSRAAAISVILQIAWLCLGNKISDLRDGTDPLKAEINEIESIIHATTK
jgi:hypothetical protein